MMMFSRGIASALLQDLGGHAGDDGAAAFADRKPQLLLHRDRRDQLDRHLRVVPRHHYFHAGGEFHRPRHVRRPQLKLRPTALEKRRVPAPLPPPFSSAPHPTISTSSPTFTFPRSIRPVATVPRPVIENTSSTGIRNGLSISRFGTGMLLSRAVSSSSTFPAHCLSPSIAFSAAPRMTGVSSPGNWYLDNSSRTSSSTRSSSSGSSTRSHLFRKTTIAGTFTCRASRMCSRVCGIGPSTALTTRIAPSICAAPVIMFFP